MCGVVMPVLPASYGKMPPIVLSATDVICSGVVPLLVTVIVLGGELVVPTLTEPNDTVGGCTSIELCASVALPLSVIALPAAPSIIRSTMQLRGPGDVPIG